MSRPLTELTDEELIAGFQEGDEKAFTELVHRFKDPLMNFVFRYVGDWDECYDIVQDTFVRMYRSKHSYKPIAKLSTWVYTIAVNLCKTYLRRRKLRRVFGLDSTQREYQSAPAFDPPDEHQHADRLAESSVLEERIQQALESLDAKYREVIILRDIQDLPYDEIAVMTGLNIGTVKSRINRGRTFLQEKLKDLMSD